MDIFDYKIEETIGFLPLITKLLKEYYKIEESSPLFDYSNRKLFADKLKEFESNSSLCQTFDNGTPDNTEDDYEGFKKDTVIKIPKAKKDLAELIGMEVGNTKDETINTEKTKILSNPLWSKGEEDKDINDKLIKTAVGDLTPKKGDTGEHIGKIQDALYEFNIINKEDKEKIRCNFEEKTETAVKLFQKAKMSVEDPSGMVGSNTLIAMDEALNENWKLRFINLTFTFDDGPGKFTASHLSNIPQDMPVAFFVSGKGFVKYNYKQGQVHIHYFDVHSTYSSYDSLKPQITKTLEVIEKNGLYDPDSPKYYRSPGGTRNEAVKRLCKELKLFYVFWDIDSEDWLIDGCKLNSDQKKILIALHILKGLIVKKKEYYIILMHDTHKCSVDSFNDFLKPILYDKNESKLNDMFESAAKNADIFKNVLYSDTRYKNKIMKPHMDDIIVSIKYFENNMESLKNDIKTMFSKFVQLEQNNSSQIIKYF